MITNNNFWLFLCPQYFVCSWFCQMAVTLILYKVSGVYWIPWGNNYILICFVANRLERSSICSRMGWQRTSMPFLHFPRLLPFNLLLGLTVTTSITILNWFMNIYDMYVRTDLRSGEWSIMEICLKKKSTGHWSLLWALVNFKYVHDEYPRLCGQEQYRDYDAAARFWTRTQPMQLSNVWVCLLDPIVPELSLST